MTGFIVLDKPKNITSFGAVARVRRITGEKKAGHTGTLDPMATGVLPVMLGGATRFAELLPCHDKGYRAEVRLGITTDTRDITGNVLTENKSSVTAEDLQTVLKRFTGTTEQTPPMFSALSKDGVRLYELARKGIEVEREKRQINIYSLELIDFDEKNQTFTLDVFCSAGTYVRSLAADIGEALGCGAVLAALHRTRANGFRQEESISLERLEELVRTDCLYEHLIPVEKVLVGYPAVFVTPAQAIRFKNGGALDRERIKVPDSYGFFRVYSPDNTFLGVGELREDAEEMTVKRVYLPK